MTGPGSAAPFPLPLRGVEALGRLTLNGVQSLGRFGRFLAQALLLVAQSFVLSGSIAEDVAEDDLRIELARIIDALLAP